MKPNVTLEEHWDIAPVRVDVFDPAGANPVRKSRTWLVNREFLLRADPLSLFHERVPVKELTLFLKEQGIPVLLPKGNKAVKHEDRVYQLFDYVHQEQQGRLDYRNEPEKAEGIGAVLASISNLKKEWFSRDSIRKAASMMDATESTLKRIKTDDRKIEQALHQAHNHLKENLFPFLPYLEKRFCHGDLHPGNLLWKGHQLHSVIDWEKAGVREELYDLAFLIGCVGMDDTAELTGKWVNALIRSYLSNTQTTKLSFELLPELVLAIRMYWMSVWLSVPDDFEIAEMEAGFWGILINNREEIGSAWKSGQDCDFKYSENRWVMQDAWMVEEINKAKERLQGRNILEDELAFQEGSEAEQFSTDLRLMAIDFGMNDDIRSLCRILHQQERLTEKYPESTYIKIEQALTNGNASLDFSKFRMIRAMDHILWECERMMRASPDVKELKVGYAFMIRNASILFAEINEHEKAMTTVEKHIRLADENPHDLDIREELARSLSNAVTSMLAREDSSSTHGRVQRYFQILEGLFKDHPDSRKIKAAHSIAKTNIRKAGT